MGEFEQIVLLALLRIGEGAYGMRARREIERLTGRDVAIGAIYTTLARLERKGWVRHRMGDPSPERGGRAKKHFQVTPEGISALEDTRQALDVMWDGVRLRRGGAEPS